MAKHISSSHTGAETFNIGIVNLPAMNFAANSGVDSIENIEISFKAIAELPQTHEVSSRKETCFKCNICGVDFNAKLSLQKHKKSSHKKQSFKCEECNAEFTSNQSLKAHVSSIHDGIKKVCSICFKPVIDLNRHIRTQHKNGGMKNFQCDICKIQFRTKFSVERHKEIVHLKLKAWPCDLCEKSFGERRDMIRHKNAVHFGIKNKSSVWNCPECDILFKLRRDYDKHKAAYHSELNEEQIVKFLNSEMEAKQKQKFSINLYPNA